MYSNWIGTLSSSCQLRLEVVLKHYSLSSYIPQIKDNSVLGLAQPNSYTTIKFSSNPEVCHDLTK